MDEDQQNSEIEKIANLMIHDGISLDEQDVAKLEKYKNQIKEDCNLNDETSMKLVYESFFRYYHSLGNTSLSFGL